MASRAWVKLLRRKALAAGVLVLAAFLVWGCAPAPKMPAPTAGPAPEAKLDKTAPPSVLEKVADDRLSRGRYLLAIDAYLAALSKAPTPLAASRMRLNLAKAYQGSGQEVMALEQLRSMPIKGGDPEALTKALLMQADLERKLGQLNQSSATLRRLSKMPPRPLSEAEQRQVLDSLAATQSALGQYGLATGTLLELAGLEGFVTPSLQLRLANTAGRASAAELESQLGLPRPPKLNAILLLALSRAQFREGSLNESLSTLSQVDGLVEDPDIEGQAKVLRQEIKQAKLVDPVAVGVLLPLSGPWAQTGKEVLSAVELGLGLYENVAGKAPVLYIADSRGRAMEAAAQVDRLVDQHKVMAIIGPLGAGTSLAAARQAQARQVPLVSLARIDGVAQSGPYVFQDSLTPQRQVDGLLAEAMSFRGKKRFAVLAPDNSYGRGFSGLLEKGVATRGGEVVRKVYYDPKSTDFTQYVQKLVKLPPGKYRLGSPNSPEPVIDFEALFIPDGPQAVAMATSQLRFFDVVGVLLMGTNLWHEANLLELAERDVQGAIIPGCFDPNSSEPVVVGFVSDYQKAMQRTPTLLEAQGYDAARVLRHLIRSNEAPRTRQAMRDALLAIKELPGVCGPITVNPQRMFDQPVTIFTVDHKAFRPVQPRDRVGQATAPLAEGTTPLAGQVQQ
ncbi:MAG: penicillin-binding protein activator [Deltaproteobacteria bacterium]|nr:penicillin-binding protein activator [Deltaproteobacteria bacterium]